MFSVERMHAKLRIYFLLIAVSGLVFLLLYKTLITEEQDSESHATHNVKDTRPNERTIKPKPTFLNINDLLPVTQPAKHLERQRLKEAEVHANIQRNSYGKLNSNRANEHVDNIIKDDLDIDHPGVPVNERVSKGMHTPKPDEIIPIEHKFVHLDLKGAPPIATFYKKLFPLLRALGATGVLMEYEDMFPFDGPLESLSAHNAYSRTELAEILGLAKQHHLEVMPLIQTFGHMEFVLKLQAYQDLREIPAYPQVICPSRNASHILIRQIIDQVVSQHPRLKWLHIGSDEVYYIGECNLCQQRMQKHFMDKERLFIEHVKEVARYVKEKYGIQPIMWDDMFRTVTENTIKHSEIWKYVHLMAWQYSPHVEAKIEPEVWEKYGRCFTGIWAASAFKGATGPNQYLTNISYHVENHISWVQVISRYHRIVPFKGFVLTGWQRYDHFAVLCELLPVAIPSLAIDLLFLKQQKLDNELIQKVREILMCDEHLGLSLDSATTETSCSFPGSDVFKGAQRLAHLKYMLEKMLSNSHFEGWMSDYNINMLFSSPAHVELGTQNLESLSSNASLIYTYMQSTMLEVYDKFTINEWLQTYIHPIIVKIDKIKKGAYDLLKFHSWPRRPLSGDSGRNPANV